jgi:hypothetical protein
MLSSGNFGDTYLCLNQILVKMKRHLVTPYVVFIFLIVSTSGILMFFHWFDDYTTVVHEFLGLTFFVFAIFHVIANWNSIRNYSGNKKFFVPWITVSVVAISLVVAGKMHGNLERDLMDRLLKSPVSASFQVLHVDYDLAKTILQKNNIIVRDSLESLEEISIKNQKSPEEIVELIYVR